MTPSAGWERSSVGCGWPSMPVHEPLISGLSGSWSSFPLWRFWEEKTSSHCVRGTNATDWGAVLFSECKPGCRNPPGHGRAGLALCFSPTSSTPTALTSDVRRPVGQHRGLQDLGREFLSGKWAFGCTYTDGHLGTGQLWTPPKDIVGPMGAKMEWETWN